MPRRGEPLRKLGFLTIGRFDAADPGPGIEETLRDHRARRGAGLRQRVAARPAPAAGHLLAGGDHGRRQSAHPPHRARHRRHPAGSGEPVPAGRGPRHRRHPVRRPDQPGRLGRHADALRPLQDRAVPGIAMTSQDFSKDRVLRLLRCLRGEPVSDFAGTVGIEQFTDRIQPHSPGLADRVWYGGGLASAIWAGEQGINYLTSSVVEHRGHRVARLRHHPGRADRRLPRAPPASRKGAGVTGSGRHPHRLGDRRPDPALPRVRREQIRAHQDAAGPARHAVLPRLRRHRPTNSPTSCSPTPGSSAPTKSRSRCRSPSAPTTTPRSSTTWPRTSGPALGWTPAQ